MIRIPSTFATIIAATFCFNTEAFSHASLEVQQAPANAVYKAVLRVPHGCDGKATHTVTVTVPEGVIAAKPMPKAGWALSTVKGPYAKSYDYYGTPTAEGVKTIIWSGGSLSDDHYDEFIFRARITDFADGHVLSFPAVQDCDGGQVAWTEVPAPGQDPHDLKRPAPTLFIAGQSKHGQARHTGHDATGMPISVDGAFARASAGQASNGVAFMTIHNAGGSEDRLIAVTAKVS